MCRYVKVLFLIKLLLQNTNFTLYIRLQIKDNEYLCKPVNQYQYNYISASVMHFNVLTSISYNILYILLQIYYIRLCWDYHKYNLKCICYFKCPYSYPICSKMTNGCTGEKICVVIMPHTPITSSFHPHLWQPAPTTHQ